jgi:predicted alpha/beta-hydrolase family hydrolase
MIRGDTAASEVPRIYWKGAQGSPKIILAHGAGTGRNSEFMTAFADGLASRGLRAGLFDFPYMTEIGRTGRRRPPNPMPVLTGCWKSIIMETGPQRLVIGGKSLGGRAASLIADESSVAGLVCLGFPFHAPGRPPGARIGHLGGLTTPTLICQGERDPFGSRPETAEYSLSPRIRCVWLPDGDHSFKPRRASGRTEIQNRNAALDAVAEFVHHIAR